MPPAERTIVAAVVLAAGSSTRMGRNKLLLELGGETVVRRSARAAIGAGVDRVVVVLGHEAERVGAELSGLPCLAVVNPDHAQGVGTSLHLGVERAASEAGAVVVVLADMPFVTAGMIGTVVARYRATGKPLVVSQYGDVEAPPILYDRALFGELLSVPGERCAKVVVRRHKHEAAVVPWPVEALRDIDVADDYERARADLAGA
jgi:molybdenum cofactor cytidylyltransferase